MDDADLGLKAEEYFKKNKKELVARLTDEQLFPPEAKPLSMFMAGSLTGQRACDLEPLIFQRLLPSGRGLARAVVPVAGIPEVSLLAMEPCMDPRPGRIGEILARIMGLVPATRSRKPENPQFRRQSGGRVAVFGGGLGKTFSFHA